MPFDPKKLDAFPTQSGVYLMKNQKGAVLYVGKANNLRQRIKQYFVTGGGGDQRLMVPSLSAKIAEIETIIVMTEKEALLLENNLIKKYWPKYNVLLKDDKSYIALKLSKHEWPALKLVRYKGKPKSDGQYFGPYTSGEAARQTFDLLNHLFPLRQCSDQEFVRRTRPCILYDMKKCLAPCVHRCTKEDYKNFVNQTVKFLKGQDKEVLNHLHKEMMCASEALEFERAGLILKKIKQIESTLEAQNVDRPFGEDTDALAIYRQGDEIVLSQLLFRSGKLMGSRHFDFAQVVQEDAEILESFLVQHYEPVAEIPHEILLPVALGNEAAIVEIIAANKQRKVRLFKPQRGEKIALIEMALANAKADFEKRKDAQAIAQRTLMEMQEKFHLTRYPHRIECFDNSNLFGEEPVSALAVFTNGTKNSSCYRKYRIKTVKGPDDYSSMAEVLLRRYKRAKEEDNLPDLIVIDGGKGHLNIALKVLKELDIISVDVIGVAKEKGRHDKGMTSEQVFLPGVKDPILLRMNSPILFLLQRIRDEAHRFAIRFHRQLRSKKTISSVLEQIAGIGPVKRKALLRRFGSIKAMREATPEQIKEVSGISQADLIALQQFLKKVY